jgi:tRNA dimethylallyltransferase
LAQELEAKDPELARALDLKNPRRVLRGLEVLQATGKPLSWWQAQPRQGGLGAASLLWLGLDSGPEALEQRISARHRAMLDQGWLDEAAALRQGVGEDKVRATGAIGYAEAFDLLDGRLDGPRAAASVQLKTRQYAKRQRTWFRRMPGIQWLGADLCLAQARAALEKLA